MLGNHLFFIPVLPLFALFSLILKNSWKDILEKAVDPIAICAYGFTIKMALIAALFNSIFGFLITWVITRYEFKGKKFIDAAVDLPFALPTSVAGLTLATVYGNQGWVGRFLKMGNLQIIYTKFGVLLAMIFVSFPFVIRSLQPVLQGLDHGLEEAAWCLGASSFQTFLRVIFPTLVPALVTGFTLSFSRALGEFGSVVMISSNLPLDDLVTSVLIYQSLEQYDYFGASVIGAVILMIALLIIFLINTAQAFYSRR
uniref:Probable sulfate transport system permease protein cysT n=1 Tax=Prototheca wickerhamii TaxID=3111 RepID=CYST_PROWI|nr:RecName: Full=Probable sulfate transport system permease protein cysT [Prototheca wickerhamii]CAB53107.1 sulfate transport permease protein [Prototheca wickerhamii]